MTTRSIAEMFRQDEKHGLPVFQGRSDEDHRVGWELLIQTDTTMQWQRAAIAASLESQQGQRTDRKGQRTRIQAFCEDVGIGVSYFSNLVRVYRVFTELLVAGNKKLRLRELLNDRRLYFKHFVAASGLPLPVEGLIEALDMGWSANEFARFVARRKDPRLLLEDADDLNPAHDNPDPMTSEWRIPEKATKPPETRTYTLLLTKQEERSLKRRLRDLANLLGTSDSHPATILAIVERAHAEWVMKAPAREKVA